MPNFSKNTLARIGRLLNPGAPDDPVPLVKLAKAGAFGRKAIYNWSLPDSDPQHRKMPRAAKRMVAMLAYFGAAGLLDDKRLEEIIALETVFETETETTATLRRVRRAIGGKGKAAATKGAGRAAEAAKDEDDDEELDEDEHEEGERGASPVSHVA